MPAGDPAGYLPRVKRDRLKREKPGSIPRSFPKRPVRASLPLAPGRVAAKTGGSLAPTGGPAERKLRRKLDQLRNRKDK